MAEPVTRTTKGKAPAKAAAQASEPPPGSWGALNGVVRQMRRHPTIAPAALLALVAATELYAVGRGDADVIRALLTYMDVPKAVLALFLGFVPIVALIFTFVAWASWIGEYQRGATRTLPWWPPLLTAIALLVCPVWILVVIVVLMLYIGSITVGLPWIQRRRGKGPVATPEVSPPDAKADEQPSGVWAVARSGVGAVLVLAYWIVISLFVLDRPWVAGEVIVVQPDSTKPPTLVDIGYVMGVSGGSLVILWDSDRGLWVVPENHVVSRDPCRVASFLDGSTIRGMIGERFFNVPETLHPCSLRVVGTAESYDVMPGVVNPPE